MGDCIPLAVRLTGHDEGRESKAYQDDKGNWTVGSGTNMSGVNLSEDERWLMLVEPFNSRAGSVVVDGSCLVLTVDFSEQGISGNLIDLLLANDVVDAFEDLRSFRWFESLGLYQRVSVLCLRYWLGATRFRKFKKTIGYLEQGDTTAAAKEMMDSQAGGRYRTRMLRLKHLMQFNEPTAFMKKVFEGNE